MDISVSTKAETSVKALEDEIKSMQHELYLLNIEQFNIKYQIFYWLYSPTMFTPLDNIIKQCQSENIPMNIVVHKIVQHMLLNDKKDFAEIKSLLTTFTHLTNLTDDQLNEIITFCQQPHLTKYFSENIMSKIYPIAINPPVLQSSHLGYPLPNPVQGRPKISWQICAHAHCNQFFPTESALIEHLNYYKKYIPYMHIEHENAVTRLNLTPLKIATLKMTRCPSTICSDSHNLFTPESLCEHFRILGIEPFWEHGMVIKAVEADPSSYSKIYSAEECVVCLNNKPEAIIYPCFHHVYCFDCIGKVDCCSVCRSPITTILPF